MRSSVEWESSNPGSRINTMDGFVSQLVVGAGNLSIGFTVGWLFKGARVAKQLKKGTDRKIDSSAILDVINEVESSAFAQARNWKSLRNSLSCSEQHVELQPFVQSNECYNQLLKAHESQLSQLDPKSIVVTQSFKSSLADNREGVQGLADDLRATGAADGVSDVTKLLSRLERLETSNNALCAELLTVREKAAEQSRELEKTRTAALEDFLTKLPNRRAFDRRFAEANATFDRSGQTYSLALIDLDHFKKINDTYGHDAGDSVLSVTGRVLSDTCRTSDFVARFGGEEFVILMPDSDLEGAKVLCERIRTRLETTVVRHEDKSIRITCSIGLAHASSECVGQRILRAADELLYMAKGNGRNQVCDVSAFPTQTPEEAPAELGEPVAV